LKKAERFLSAFLLPEIIIVFLVCFSGFNFLFWLDLRVPSSQSSEAKRRVMNRFFP